MSVRKGPPGTVLPARRRWTVLGICTSAMFLVGLDTTTVAVGLPEIGHGLGVEEDRLAWIIDAYTVVFASFLITSGALADRFGRRLLFQTGLVVFALASLACALAPSLGALVAARAVQGIGASMLSPVALAIVVNAMPDPRERATAIGIWGSMFGLSMAAGPLTGGALLELLDWRALFWINIPVALVALVLVALIVPESKSQCPRRLDLWGQTLLVLLLAAAVALLIEGPGLGWGSPITISTVLLLAVLVAVLVIVESRRREPLIDPGVFGSLRFSGAVLCAVSVFVAFSMTLLMSTVLLQETQGWTPLATGAATLPMAVGVTVCAPVSGRLVGQIGPRLPLLVAGCALTAGGVVFLVATANGLVTLMPWAYLVVGIGVGFANAPITNTAISGLPTGRAGVAGGIASTARQIGIAIGIALAGSIIARADDGELASAMTAGWLVVVWCGVGVLMVGTGATGPVRRRG